VIIEMFFSFLAFLLYLQLGLYVLFTKPGSKMNRAYFYLCMSLVIWSFGYIFIHAATSLSSVLFWERVSSFGWVFFPALLVSFFFVLNKTKNLLFKYFTQLAFYLAGILFFIQSLLGNLLTNEYFFLGDRWVFKPDTGSIWYISFMIYLVMALVISFYLLIKWSLTTRLKKEKRQSGIIMITLTLYFLGILINNYLLPIFRPIDFPGLIHITSFFWVAGFSIAIVKHKFLVLSPQTAANEIISNMKELLFFLNTEGKIIRVNSFTRQLLGFEWSELKSKPFESLLMEKESVQSLLAEKDELEDIKPHKHCLRTKKGELIHFNLSSAEVKDDAGDVLGTIIVGYDLRYEKMLEEALRESEQKYKKLYVMVRLMCDNVPDLIWVKDPERRYIFANKATCRLLNAEDPEEPLGKTEEYFIEREKERHSKNPKWFTYSGTSEKSDSIVMEKLESIRYLESGFIRGDFAYYDVYKAPFRDEEDRLIGIIGCGRNVSREKQIEQERQKAEIALSEEKELLAVTLKSIGEGVISTDRDGRVVMINSEAEKLTGWERDEIIGKRVEEVYKIVKPKSQESVVNPVDIVLKKEKTVVEEHDLVLISKSGKEILISQTGSPIYSQEGEIIGVVIIFSDITQKQLFEQELLKIQKLETVGILASGIAHDFNNILTTVLGNISLVTINLDESNEHILNRLQTAEKACFRARDLIKQLLTFAKGKELIKNTIRLNRIIEDSVHFAVKGSNIQYLFNIAQDLKPVEVDESQICQVLNNLIINAKQAMPDSGVIIVDAHNVFITENSGLPLKDGEYVKIQVKDTGKGIEQEELGRIFDLFYTTKEKGTGLGLPISFKIVQRHGGSLIVDSEVGKGSTFTVYLPVSERDLSGDSGTEEETKLKVEGSVIVMDDDFEIRSILRNMLESIGFYVICTRDGEETLKVLKELRSEKKKIAFVVLDLIVNRGMGGKEVIAKIREITPEIKAILSSGYSNDPILAEYRDHGFDTVIEKPYTIINLIKTIKSLAQNNELRESNRENSK